MKGEGKEGPGVHSREEWKLPSMTFHLVGPVSAAGYGKFSQTNVIQEM